MDDKSIFYKLEKEANKIVGKIILNENSNHYEIGVVACALITDKGNIYTGINLLAPCVGICAERAAIMEMLKHKETKVTHLVALNKSNLLSPCGVCREALKQINNKNMDCKIKLENKIVLLKDLLPEAWIG